MAPDIVGFLARTGLAAAIARGADTNADAIFAQIAAIETATGLAVDGIVMNPAQLEDDPVAEGQRPGNYIVGGGPFWRRPRARCSGVCRWR